MSEDPKKWEITIDIMMIIGKYLEENKDFINIMKLNKKFKELVEMYKMNPISDPSLFPNIQTQHFYKEEDVINKKNGLYQYIYWCLTNQTVLENKNDNDIFKNVELVDVRDSSVDSVEYENNTPYVDNEGVSTIPEGINKIEDYYYCDCDWITKINLPSTLREIGESAFERTGIKEIIIPDSVTKIGINCFNDCELTKVQLSYNLVDIGASAFMDTRIISITLPEGITIIREKTFCQCRSLSEINLPSSLIRIDNEVFCETKIEEIFIPPGVTYIGDLCFDDCEYLKILYIPENIKLGKNVFRGTNLKGIKHYNRLIK